MHGRLVHTYRAHQAAILNVMLAADLGVFVTSGADQALRVWRIGHDEALFELSSEGLMRANLLRFPKMPFIVSGAVDGLIQFWNIETGEWVRDLAGHSASVESMAMSLDGMRIASLAADGQLCVWDTLSGEMRYSLSVAAGHVHKVGICPEGQHLIYVTRQEDGSALIHLLSLADGSSIRQLQLEAAAFSSFALLPQSHTIVLYSNDGQITQFDWQTGELLHQMQMQPGMSGLELVPSLDAVLLAFETPSLSLWHSTQGHQLLRFDEPASAVRALSCRVNGTMIIVGCEDGTLHRYEIDGG